MSMGICSQKQQVKVHVLCVIPHTEIVCVLLLRHRQKKQNVVPGDNFPLAFSSETTNCHVYDKYNINQTCLL